MMTFPHNKTSHHPFWIRKSIVLSALVLGVIGGYLGESIFLGLALYFCAVTFFDGISHYIFHLKASNFVDIDKLKKSERVTPEELDIYFDTRRNIRFVSFAIASYCFGVAFFVSAYALEAFCSAYVASTLLGILYVRFFVNIQRPRWIYRDDRYYVPRHYPRPGYISLEQFGLRTTGIYFYGPVDF
jgi:hypothetical protein